MSEINTSFTNVDLQKFASEGDRALVNQQWEKLGSKYLERLGKSGLLSYEVAKGQSLFSPRKSYCLGHWVYKAQPRVRHPLD